MASFCSVLTAAHCLPRSSASWLILPPLPLPALFFSPGHLALSSLPVFPLFVFPSLGLPYLSLCSLSFHFFSLSFLSPTTVGPLAPPARQDSRILSCLTIPPPHSSSYPSNEPSQWFPLRDAPVAVTMNASPWQCELVGSLKALHKLIDSAQLAIDLGGSFPYNHSDWICFRRVRAARGAVGASPLWEVSLKSEKDIATHLMPVLVPSTVCFWTAHCGSLRVLLEPSAERGRHCSRCSCGHPAVTERHHERLYNLRWSRRGNSQLLTQPLTEHAFIVSSLTNHDKSWSPSPRTVRKPLFSYKVQSAP